VSVEVLGIIRILKKFQKRNVGVNGSLAPPPRAVRHQKKNERILIATMATI
tara:strand:+ start:146 stop:298 length:153 start_codon:yes stop_codon:yes gene_type:complete